MTGKLPPHLPPQWRETTREYHKERERKERGAFNGRATGKGTAPRAAEAPSRDEGADNTKPRKNALPYTKYDDIDITGRKNWIFKNIIARGEISNWIGPPGSFKSSLMAEAAVHCSANSEWRGHRNKGPCAVVYFALERGDLVKRRLAAYRARGLVGLPIVVVSKTFSLMDPKCTSIILETIHDVQDDLGMSVGFVIIDTMAKGINAGGGDEDKAKDKGVAIANLRKVIDMLDAHIAVVGHTGKDETRGARGSNADLADADVQVQISGDADVKTALVTKANDLPLGPLFSFRGTEHEFGTDEDGDAIGVYILSPENIAPEQTEQRAVKPPKSLTHLIQAIEHCHEAAISLTPYLDAPSVQAVQADIVKGEFFRTCPGGGGDERQQGNTRRHAWNRALKLAGDRKNGFVGFRLVERVEWLWLIK